MCNQAGFLHLVLLSREDAAVYSWSLSLGLGMLLEGKTQLSLPPARDSVL